MKNFIEVIKHKNTLQRQTDRGTGAASFLEGPVEVIFVG